MSSIVDKSFFDTLEYLPVGYFILNKDYKVVYWNKTIELISGLTKDEIISKEIENYFPNFSKEIVKQRIDPIFKGGPPVIFSAKLHKNLFSGKDSGNVNYFQVTITSLQYDQDNHYALFSIENRNEVYNQIDELIDSRDRALDEVDKKNQLHSQLSAQHNSIREAFKILSEKNAQIENQKQQLLELNATKDKFFSIIAHDLVNPFSNIMGYSSLIVDRFESFDPLDIKEMISQINQTAQNTYDLLQNLLQWSRIQSNRIENHPIRLNLHKLVHTNIQLVMPGANDKNIQVSNNIPEELFVLADHHLINTVIRNLISNAIKFTEKGGKIDVDIEELTDSQLTQDNNNVNIVIKDTGVGISKEDLETLFRVEHSNTTVGTNDEQGTGLGLILCKEFIELMGSKIWVESDPGKGSSFRFTLKKSS